MRGLVASCLVLALSWSVLAQPVTTNEGEFDCHITANNPSGNTPVTTAPDGTIYVVCIDDDLDLHIYRKAVGGAWTSAEIITDNVDDEFHGMASVAIDKLGYLHVVSSMHATPWQYWMSASPNAITGTWQFLGQNAGTIRGQSTPSAANCTGQCETDWFTEEPGIARIPGNQVTYPHFFRDMDGDLYISFRECYICSGNFFARQWSSGIAKLVTPHATAPVWKRIGPGPDGVRPFAGADPNRLPIGLVGTFDLTNRMHMTWVWCNHYTQELGGEACQASSNFISYAYSDDEGVTWRQANGTLMDLPIGPTESEAASGPAWYDSVSAPGYYVRPKQLSASRFQQPLLTFASNTFTSSSGRTRAWVKYQNGAWTTPVTLPNTPAQVLIDHLGGYIAVSSGLRVHRSLDNGATWTITDLDLRGFQSEIPIDHAYLQRTGHLRFLAHRKDGTNSFAVVWTVHFPETGPCGGPLN